MSEVQPPSGQCPACHSEEIEFWEYTDSWVCSECRFVLDSTDDEPDVACFVDIKSHTEQKEDTIEPWQQRISIKDKSEANLVDVLTLTEDTGEALGLSDQSSTRAGELVTRAWESNFMHGRTQELTVGAALYAASRESTQTVPPSIIADQLQLGKSSMKTVYRDLKSDQNLDIQPPMPQNYVEYICRSLELPVTVSDRADSLLNEKNSGGGNPIGIAAGGIYEAAVIEGEDATLREIAAVVSLTKETVWRHANQF